MRLRLMLMSLQLMLTMVVICQIYQVWAVCQGSCFDDISYQCLDCTTPRCPDAGCLTGPLYWEGDCCCMKPESTDRCCYYRCYAYQCLPGLDEVFCYVLNEVHLLQTHSYYAYLCCTVSTIRDFHFLEPKFA